MDNHEEEKKPVVAQSTLDREVRLPELRKDLRDFEKAAGISVDVLVRIDGFAGMHVGRYLYGLEEWQVPWMSGRGPSVVEWWPLPEVGTGMQPNAEVNGGAAAKLEMKK